MFNAKIGVAPAAGLLKRSRALLSLGFVLFFAAPGHAQPGNLRFFTNYFITGGHRVAGVNLRTTGVNGIATGRVYFSAAADSFGIVNQVPANATVLAAFLYWQTVLKVGDSLVPTGAMFDGKDISQVAIDLNPAGTSPCWASGGGTGSSGGAHRTHTYRADVRRALPVASDGRYLVNDADLQAAGLPAGHEVKLPDAGRGNKVPSTAGATLVVIYRSPPDPDGTPAASLQPLTSIAIYDGSYSMDNSTQMMTQTIQGFYQASNTSPIASITHIVGNGSTKSERLLLATGNVASDIPANFIADNPFQGAASLPSSDPAWDNRTFNVSSHVAAGTTLPVTTRVTHVGNPFDCLTWGAVIFNTTVQDTDYDGLVDAWESSASSLYSPSNLDPTTGAPLTGSLPLPNLHNMDADPNVKDLFVEIGALKATAGTTYGPLTSGVCVPPGCEIAAVAHDHLPTPAVLKMVGDAYWCAGAASCTPSSPAPSNRVQVHFDAGNGYPAMPDTYAERYIIRGAGAARGGESIKETACVPSPEVDCQFPDFPGTVSWKVGFEFYRDGDVCDDGTEIDPMTPCSTTDHRRRFDRVRKDIFHYLLYAHSRGRHKCLNSDGSIDLTCAAANPNYVHIPGGSSGVGDLAGGDAMVSLGGWGNGFLGSQFMQASTMMHELGHNAWRRHGGDPSTMSEPNCKPNYLSIMSYMFQGNGLFNSLNPGVPLIDYSGQRFPALNEQALSDPTTLGSDIDPPLGSPRYFTSWYAPQSAFTVGLRRPSTATARHCGAMGVAT